MFKCDCVVASYFPYCNSPHHECACTLLLVVMVMASIVTISKNDYQTFRLCDDAGAWLVMYCQSQVWGDLVWGGILQQHANIHSCLHVTWKYPLVFTCSGAAQRSSFLCARGNWMQAAEAGLLIALRWQMSAAKLLQARWQMVAGGAPGHCRINITNTGL